MKLSKANNSKFKRWQRKNDNGQQGEKSPVLDHQGQALFEFLFLLFTLFTVSFGMLSAFNYNIGQRWQAMVKIIAQPTDSEIKLR